MQNAASDFQQAIESLRSCDYRTAHALLLPLINAFPNEPVIRQAYGLACAYLGDVPQAVIQLEIALSLKPEDPEIANTLLQIHCNMGEWGRVHETAAKHLAVLPTNEGARKLLETQDANVMRRTPLSGTWLIHSTVIDLHPSVLIGGGATLDIKNANVAASPMFSAGEHSQLFGSFSIQRSNAKIKIGKRSQIGASTFIAAESIEVGDDVLMAWGITLMDNDSHALDFNLRKNDVTQCGYDHVMFPNDFCRNKDWENVAIKPIVIADKSWIGFGATVLKGVTVGEGAIVGAQSVVTKDVAPYTLVAGNPARYIKSLPHRG